MIENKTLEVIRGRRSVIRFEKTEVRDDQVEAILEAGRWAPSYLNSQPWAFIVVRDPELRTHVAEILRRVTIAWQAFADAPVFVVIAVDTAMDPRHFIEDGAAAAQNMALMAHGLGLASFWAGILREGKARGSPEEDLRTLLKIPIDHRIVAALPIGFPTLVPEGSRKPLAEMLHREVYSSGKRAG